MTDSLLGSSSNSQGSGQSTETPVSMTPPAYAALQSPVASGLSALFSGGPVYSGPSSVGGSLSTTPAATSPSTFSAPITGNESSLLNAIMGLNGGSAALAPAQSYLSSVLSPGYLSGIVSSPGVQQAISSAIAPLQSTYQNVTLPNLQGSFVANGHVLNGPAQPGTAANGSGDSAFDKAASIAQTGLEQAEGQTAGGIVNQALTNAMGQQTQAATQAQTLSTTQVNNLVSTLQAEALPRLIQQYGMDEGLQQFNNRVQVLLEALGIGAQVSGPDVAQQGQSTQQTESESGSGAMGLFNQLFGSGGLLGL